MSMAVIKLFQEAYRKIPWKIKMFDGQWPSSETLRLSRQIENQFYKRLFLRRFHFPWGRGFFYERTKRRRPDEFPVLIEWRALCLDVMTEFVPGNFISTEILGLLHSTSDRMASEMGGGAASLQGRWKGIVETLAALLQAFHQAPHQMSWLKDLENFYHDYKACYDLCVYITQLRQYSLQNKSAFLRSAHLFLWCEQSLFLAKNIYSILKRQGLLAIAMENDRTLYACFQEWMEQCVSLRLHLLVDMYVPLFSDVSLSVAIKGKEIVTDDISPLPMTWISRLFDWLFPPEPLPKIATIQHTPVPAPLAEPKNLQETVSEVICRPSPEDLDWGKVIFPPQEFIKVRQLLQNFLAMMVADLSPRYSSQGQLVESKHLFDQFDVPPLMRRFDVNRFVLKGKIKGMSPLEQQEKDEIVIKSTHWLYDRLHDILDRYVFSQSGVRGEIGRGFAEDLKSLLTAAPEEYNEVRKYAVFSQFRFNVKRIFSSASVQARYLHHIRQVGQSLVKLQEMIAEEEVRLLSMASRESS